MSRYFAHHALRLRVPLFADVEDIVAPGDEIAHKIVGYGHVWTGSVNAMQATLLSAALDQWRDAVRGEYHGALFDLFQDRSAVWTIQRDYAQRGQFFDGVAIVDNLPDDMDGTRQGWIFSSLAHYLQGINDAIAVAAWRDLYHFHCFTWMSFSSIKML
jgi:hypothetical protein